MPGTSVLFLALTKRHVREVKQDNDCNGYCATANIHTHIMPGDARNKELLATISNNEGTESKFLAPLRHNYVRA